MESNNWVYEYINKLFTIDLSTEGMSLRNSKLPYINLPLYKYCYVCEDAIRTSSTIDYNIDNFENDVLFFQNPNKFNDPFDCFLGFSQSQVIRNLLVQNLRSKRLLTPQIKKVIAQFFNEDNFNTNLVTLTNDDFMPFHDFILSLIPDDEPLKGVLSDILQNLFLQGNENLQKLITNTMTIRDKQSFVDLIFENPSYREYLKTCCSADNLDFVLTAAPQDMKIKIENEPNSFMSDNNGETYGIFDFLTLLIGASNNAEISIEEMNDIKNSFDNVSKEILKNSRKVISEQFSVTCLSEKMDSPLMWSHYANKHYGFCLEYDFTMTMTERWHPDLLPAQLFLFPVCYSEKRPLLSKAIFEGKTIKNYVMNNSLPPDFLKKVMYGLLYKSEEWAYEKEWRIFKLPSNTPVMHLPKARKVFLGANIEEDAKNRIVQIAQNKNIPIFQMFLHSDKYKFDYYQIKS